MFNRSSTPRSRPPRRCARRTAVSAQTRSCAWLPCAVPDFLKVARASPASCWLAQPPRRLPERCVTNQSRHPETATGPRALLAARPRPKNKSITKELGGGWRARQSSPPAIEASLCGSTSASRRSAQKKPNVNLPSLCQERCVLHGPRACQHASHRVLTWSAFTPTVTLAARPTY